MASQRALSLAQEQHAALITTDVIGASAVSRACDGELMRDPT